MMTCRRPRLFDWHPRLLRSSAHWRRSLTAAADHHHITARHCSHTLHTHIVNESAGPRVALRCPRLGSLTRCATTSSPRPLFEGGLSTCQLLSQQRPGEAAASVSCRHSGASPPRSPRAFDCVCHISTLCAVRLKSYMVAVVAQSVTVCTFAPLRAIPCSRTRGSSPDSRTAHIAPTLRVIPPAQSVRPPVVLR